MIIIITSKIEIPILIVITSPKYNQVIIGNTDILKANPNNLTCQRLPNPAYPNLVAHQNIKLIGIPNIDITHIDFVPLAHSQTNCEFN